MRRELEQMIVRIPACERGFDSHWPLPWLHPSGPEDLETLETVRMLLVNISEVSGFGAAQLAAGQVFEDERDVRALESACREIDDALEVLRRAVVSLRRRMKTTQETGD